MIDIPSIVFNISLHCIILFTFLSIFYWSYIIDQESKGIEQLLRVNIINKLDSQFKKSKTTINSELSNLLLKHGKDLPPGAAILLANSNMGDKLRPIVTKTLKNMVDSENRVQDMIFYDNHRIYKLLNVIIFMIIAIIFIFIVFYLYTNKYDIDYKSIILENVAIIVIIGIIEFIFFNTIASKYEPLDDNDINEFATDIIKQL